MYGIDIGRGVGREDSIGLKEIGIGADGRFELDGMKGCRFLIGRGGFYGE